MLLSIGSGFMQPNLKNAPQLFMLAFGLLTLVSLRLKKPFRTSILFYVLLTALLYANINLLANLALDGLFPEKTGMQDSSEIIPGSTSINWIWSVFAALLLSPLITFIYHKKIKSNKAVEVLLPVFFIVVTVVLMR